MIMTMQGNISTQWMIIKKYKHYMGMKQSLSPITGGNYGGWIDGEGGGGLNWGLERGVGMGMWGVHGIGAAVG